MLTSYAPRQARPTQASRIDVRPDTWTMPKQEEVQAQDEGGDQGPLLLMASTAASVAEATTGDAHPLPEESCRWLGR